MSIMAIATALAVPSMRDFIANNRAASEANALIGSLSLARNEAVTRGVPVSVCASKDGATCLDDDDWSVGWIVFTDANPPRGSVDDGAIPDTVLRAYESLGPGSALTATAAFVPYQPSGFLAGGGAMTFELAVPNCTRDHNRTISINPQGRPTVAHAACAD